MRIEHTVEIERPPDEVYAFLADPENLPRWQSEVSAVRRESDTRFTETRTVLGKRVESTLEVTAAEPGREFSIRTEAGPVAFAVRHLLEPAGEGRTLLRVTGESEDAGRLFKVGGRLLGKVARGRMEDDFARLKELLESS